MKNFYLFDNRNMPDIESLMQEWPPEFEELLNQVNHFENIKLREYFYNQLPKRQLKCAFSYSINCN